MSGFTHFDAQGNAIMVDVTDKDITERCATASGCIRVSREVFDAVKDGTAKKGDVLGTARIARDHGGQTDLGADPAVSSTDADKGHHRFCYGRGDLHDPLFLYGKIIRAYRRGDGGTDRGERGTAYHL